MSVEVYDFRSDNVGGVAPELLEALLDANRGTAAPYGDDDCTRAMTARFRHAFEHDGLLAFPLAAQAPGSFQQRLLDAHNQERARIGVKPLVWSPVLAAKARVCMSCTIGSGDGQR